MEDFSHAHGDLIGLTGFGPALDSFAEVTAAATQIGADTVIVTGTHSGITLAGIARGTLAASDFYFA